MSLWSIGETFLRRAGLAATALSLGLFLAVLAWRGDTSAAGGRARLLTRFVGAVTDDLGSGRAALLFLLMGVGLAGLILAMQRSGRLEN